VELVASVDTAVRTGTEELIDNTLVEVESTLVWLMELIGSALDELFAIADEAS